MTTTLPPTSSSSSSPFRDMDLKNRRIGQQLVHIRSSIPSRFILSLSPPLCLKSSPSSLHRLQGLIEGQPKGLGTGIMEATKMDGVQEQSSRE